MKRAFVTGCLVASLLVVLFFALNYLSLRRHDEQRIPEAFASGALTTDNFRNGDAVNGSHQFNDCLVLAMAIDQRGTTGQLTVSPSLPFKPYAEEPCKLLKAGAVERPYYYHNYIHGQTALLRFLLPILDIATIRELYRDASSLLLVAGIALAMLRVWQGGEAVFLIVLLCFARFFGLEAFGQSLGHAPADFVLLSFIVSTMFEASDTEAINRAAIFGSLTMIFEMMTGGLPLGLAAVIGLTLYSLKSGRLSTVWQCAAAYLVGAACTLVLKYLAVGLVFGLGSLAAVPEALGARINGALPGYAHPPAFPVQVIGNLDSIITEMPVMAALILALCICFGAMSAIRLQSPQSRFLALSNLPIVAWFVVFHQHTMLHAFFMDRMFVWPIASGFALFALAQLDLRARQAPTQEPTPDAGGFVNARGSNDPVQVLLKPMPIDGARLSATVPERK